jgi:hypothetical protein
MRLAIGTALILAFLCTGCGERECAEAVVPPEPLKPPAEPLKPPSSTKRASERKEYDLAEYAGADAVTDPGIRALLKKNGFAVTGSEKKQMFNFYMRNPNGFITTDSAFHCFHVLFEELLRDIEFENARRMRRFCRRLFRLTSTLPGEYAQKTRQDLCVFSAVPARLMGITTPLPGMPGQEADRIRALVDEEVRLIKEARSPSAPSPFTGQKHD